MNDIDQEIPQDSANVNILDDLDDIDKAIIQYKVKEPSITNVEIAKRLEVHRDTIAARLKKVKVDTALKEIQKSALQILLDSQSAAARRLSKIVKDGNDADATRAAKEILKGVLSENVNLNLNKSPIVQFLSNVSEEDIEGYLTEEKTED
jgi:IS30 family transposase